jgi:hypothetical protein
MQDRLIKKDIRSTVVPMQRLDGDHYEKVKYEYESPINMVGDRFVIKPLIGLGNGGYALATNHWETARDVLDGRFQDAVTRNLAFSVGQADAVIKTYLGWLGATGVPKAWREWAKGLNAKAYQSGVESSPVVEEIINYFAFRAASWLGQRLLGGARRAAPALGEAATTANRTVGALRRELQVINQTSCFVAGTPLLTPDGEKPIEDFRAGDQILSRPEANVDGAVEVKVVEETFVRSAPVLRLQVGGRTIRTTAEHPFYVRGKGWTCAKELRTGDSLSSHDGQWITVEDVSDVEDVATVYNLRVSDYHTYFVGSRGWGFSVWAHNINCNDVWKAIGRTGAIPESEEVRRALSAVVDAWHSGANEAELARLIRQIPGHGLPTSRRVLEAADTLVSLRPPPTLAVPAASSAQTSANAASQSPFTATRNMPHIRPNLIAEDMRPWQLRDHGHPSKWTYQYTRSPEATGVGFGPLDRKVYEVYTDIHGRQIEYHYHILGDGRIVETKVKFPGTTS